MMQSYVSLEELAAREVARRTRRNDEFKRVTNFYTDKACEARESTAYTAAVYSILEKVCERVAEYLSSVSERYVNGTYQEQDAITITTDDINHVLGFDPSTDTEAFSHKVHSYLWFVDLDEFQDQLYERLVAHVGQGELPFNVLVTVAEDDSWSLQIKVLTAQFTS